MKNEIIEKVNKIGKAGQIIAKIGKVILTIAFVACLVTAVFVCVIPKDMITMDMSHQAIINIDLNEMEKVKDIIVIETPDNQNVETALEINGIEYEVVNYEQDASEMKVYADAETHGFTLSNIWWLMIPALLSVGAIYIVLCFIEKLCILFRDCETPFTDEVVNALKKLAISIIPMACLSSITQSISDSILTGNIDIVIGIDLMTVILVVLIFMLAAIFKYGTMLQIESDETL